MRMVEILCRFRASGILFMVLDVDAGAVEDIDGIFKGDGVM